MVFFAGDCFIKPALWRKKKGTGYFFQKGSFCHFSLKKAACPPFTMEVTFTDEEIAARSSWIPGAKRSGDRSVSFTSNDFMEVLKFFRFAR
jgi:hypothetical protein